jgi:cell division GTPase FtsZ
MELREGMPKTVIFGIGGAGCKTLNLIAKEGLNNTELVAIDVDKKQLYALGPSIKQVLIGETIAECKGFEEVKAALKEEIKSIEGPVEDASVAIIIAGLGKRTGTCIVNFIAELCANKRLLTLTISIYPFVTNDGKATEVNAIIKKLKELSSAVILVDNNLRRAHRSMPVLDVFREVNSLIVKMVKILVNSVCGLNSMNLSVDELRYFFYGDFINIMVVAEDNNLVAAAEKALKDLHRYVEGPSIKKMLILTTSSYETGVDDMKAINESMQKDSGSEGIKWISAIEPNNTATLIMIACVSELPLVEGVAMPDKTEVDEGAAIELVSQTFEDMAGEIKFPALAGIHLLEKPEGGIKRESKAKTHKEGKPKEVKKEPETLDVDTRRDLRAKVGEEEDFEGIASDLTGFPLFKKKGQKTIKEYTDEFGIEYI